ncbi:AAA family ATPase [Paenibacillus sp. FSL W8-1187]|uniref:KGGVGR-motif variant AAA ATPase n=1 Tax=Paenibacillus sp. FSL W8-1187 TaxID=2975339 RepID=UPI0030DD7A07
MITFSDALRECQKAVLDTNLDEYASEITIIRDVKGKVRLMADGVAPSDLEACQAAEIELARRLGVYWGDDLWVRSPHERDPHRSLADIVKSERKPVEWESDLILSNPSSCSLFILERHAAKKSWVEKNANEPLWPFQLVQEGRRPAIVSFYSFKGGVGRTTALAAVAVNLARQGLRVGIVDFDLEAPGAGSVFYPRETVSFGVVDYLIEKPIQGKQWSIRNHLQVVSDQQILGDQGETIQLVPAGVIDDLYMEKLSRIDFHSLTTNDAGKSIRDLIRELSTSEYRLDLILVDARAGFHDIGGMALTQLSHAAVLFGVQSEQTWSGLRHVIRRAANLYGDAPLPVIMVHAMGPEVGLATQAQETAMFRERSYDVFLENYYGEGEVERINTNNEDEAFYPIVVPYDSKLRGEVSLYGESTRDIVELFTRDSGPYVKLSRKLLRILGKESGHAE